MTRQDEKMRIRNRLIDQAINEASRNNWDHAVEVNRKILELGEDVETYNRLGKALQELNRYPDALDAYQQTVRLAPNNLIARRNITRLEPLVNDSRAANARSRELVDLRLFISETGKTGITSLTNISSDTIANRLNSGERVELRPDGRVLYVYTIDGELIGRVEPKLAQRLIELMGAGNQYVAAVAHTEGRQIRIVIRETFQHPSQRKKISFPGKLSGDMGTFRPYIRDYATRYDFDSDEEEADDDLDDDDEEEDLDDVSLDDVEGEDEGDDDELGS